MITLAGYAMFQALVLRMESYWLDSKSVPRNPMLSLCFKRPGVGEDFDQVCFLSSEMVSIDAPFYNRCQNPYFPRVEDNKTFLN